ncbi:Peptidoglycan-binding domain 1 [hydrothermal vent metagenome]|uniref:Peptidoglycan-binding domain 1 n=1 Tax=hydrothermal vent metagenome TaxID=652676 RepID=A0A1W1CIN4_9ZZZZ
MRILSLFIMLTFLHITLLAETFSMKSISAHISEGLQTRVQGVNKNIIKSIYAKRGNQALWIGREQVKQASDLIQALNNPLFNYKNKDFDKATISRLYYLLDNGEVSSSQKSAVYARLDLLLTSSMVRLVRFIVQGDVDWALVQKKMKGLKESDDIQSNWEMSPKGFPALSPLISAIHNGNIYGYLYSLLPMKKRYVKLIKLLNNYRVMNNFPNIPYSNSILKVGNNAKRITLVKQRLQLSGDYPKGASLNTQFTKTLKYALLTYQKRFLLKATGRLDKTVTYYMNEPVSTKIQAIITNLDKTKLYPSEFEKAHVEVNIPDFNLRYYKQGNSVYKTGVIVGRIDRPTPIFSDKIDYMVLNPTWTIPDNLIKRDLIPVLRENPQYLKENNIHAFSGKKEVEVSASMLSKYENSKKRVPYRFVQYSGENNALGRVKFMFPNKYLVYLHDTDNKSLYSRRYKVYSSGCVRVEKPFDLLNILLRYSKGNYTQDFIAGILESNKPHSIRMRESIPVHILYFTVYEENGLAYFRNDIYLYDKIIEESTASNRKMTFKVPEKRMVSIRPVRSKPMSN